MIPTRHTAGPAAGDVGAAPAARAGPAAADLGQRVRHRPRQAARRRRRRVRRHAGHHDRSGCKPYDPESKGIVERRNGFFETSFMPGRDFASPADFNAQFTDWLTKANARVVRTIKARPVDLLEADRAAMLPLPPVAAGGRVGQPGPAGPRLLRPRRRQRLLRRPGGDRPVRRRHRRPGPGRGPPRGPPGRRP